MLYVILGFVILVFITSFVSNLLKTRSRTTEIAPQPTTSRTYIGTSRFGYSLWKDGTCIVVIGVRESDLRRLNTDLAGFRQAIKDETGVSCVLIE